MEILIMTDKQLERAQVDLNDIERQEAINYSLVMMSLPEEMRKRVYSQIRQYEEMVKNPEAYNPVY